MIARPVTFFASAVLLAASAVYVPQVAGQEPGGAPPSGPRFDTPEFMRALEAQEERGAERRRQRATPEAREERRRSRTAYRGLSGQEARALAADRFKSLLLAPVYRGLRLGRGERVAEYLGDYFARVDMGEGRGDSIMRSTLPLRVKDASGQKAPVDLSLEDRGDVFAPRTPIVATRIPKRLSDGISFEGAGFAVRPLAAGASSSSPELLEDKVFHPEIARDTDAVAIPTPSGAELLLQLRSEEAPELHELEVDLPPSTQLREAPGRPGAAELVRAEQVIGLIHEPHAIDADGEPIDVSVELRGNRLLLKLAHRAADARYPILVDPLVEDFLSWTHNAEGYYDPSLGFDGWLPGLGGSCCGTMYTYAGYSNLYGSGLYAYGKPGDFYGAGRFAEWFFQAPGDAYIYRADWGWVQHDPVGYSTTVEGIWSTRDRRWETYCIGEPYQPCTNSAPFITFGALNFNFRTACPPGLGCWEGYRDNPPGSPGNIMAIALSMPYNVTLPTTTFPVVFMGGAQIGLHEWNPPSISSFSRTNAPSGWVRSGTDTVSATAHDTGLGAKAIALDVPSTGQPLGYSRHPCTGSKAMRSPCPADYSTSFTYDFATLPEGVVPVRLQASDAVGNVGPASPTQWQVKVDRTAPEVDLGGTLRYIEDPDDPEAEGPDPSPGTRGSDEYDLTVDATEVSQTQPTSGVKGIEILVDGQRVHYCEGESCAPIANDPDPPAPEDACSGEGCFSELETTWTLQAAAYPGVHTIKVVVSDNAGNRFEDSWNVDIQPVASQSSLDDDVPLTVTPVLQGHGLGCNPDNVVDQYNDGVVRIVLGSVPGQLLSPETTLHYEEGGYRVFRCDSLGNLQVTELVAPLTTPSGATALVPAEETDMGGTQFFTYGNPDDPTWAADWNAGSGNQTQAAALPPTDPDSGPPGAPPVMSARSSNASATATGPRPSCRDRRYRIDSGPDRIGWQNGTMPYYVRNTGLPTRQQATREHRRITSKQIRRAISLGGYTWNVVRDPCRPGFLNTQNVSLKYGGRSEIRYGGAYRANLQSRDQRTIIDFGDEPCSKRGGQALAAAIACARAWESETPPFYLVEADAHFVNKFAWNPFPGHGKKPEGQAEIPPRNCTKDPPSAGRGKIIPCTDIWSTAAHEIGHMIGFAHAVEQSQEKGGQPRSLLTMNWQIPRDFLGRTLGLGDVYALRCLYPKSGHATPPRCANGGTQPPP